MDAISYSERPEADVRLDAQIVERIAHRVAIQRSARHLEQDLIGVGFVALCSPEGGFAAAYYAMLDYLRKERRQQHSGITSDLRSAEATPEDFVQMEELWRMDHEPVVREIYRNGRTQSEVAASIGISQRHVGRRLNQAVTRMRLRAA